MIVFDKFDRPDGPLGPSYRTIAVDGEQAVIRAGGYTNMGSGRNAALATWATNGFSPSQYAQARLITVGPEGTDCVPIVLVRGRVESRGSAYLIMAGRNSYQRTAWCWELWRRLDGVYQMMAGGAGFGPEVKVGDVMRIEARGPIIRMLANGEVLAEACDDHLRTGTPGIGINTGDPATNNPDDQTIASDFEAGAL